jgi:hypothetical protein
MSAVGSTHAPAAEPAKRAKPAIDDSLLANWCGAVSPAADASAGAALGVEGS